MTPYSRKTVWNSCFKLLIQVKHHVMFNYFCYCPLCVERTLDDTLTKNLRQLSFASRVWESGDETRYNNHIADVNYSLTLLIVATSSCMKSVQDKSKSISSCFVIIKDGSNILFRKKKTRISIPEATLTINFIGYNSMKSKPLNAIENANVHNSVILY